MTRKRRKKIPPKSGLTEGQSPETTNDGALTKGSFTFSGELHGEVPTRTDLFTGDPGELLHGGPGASPLDETGTNPDIPTSFEETNLAPDPEADADADDTNTSPEPGAHFEETNAAPGELADETHTSPDLPAFLEETNLAPEQISDETNTSPEPFAQFEQAPRPGEFASDETEAAPEPPMHQRAEETQTRLEADADPFDYTHTELGEGFFDERPTPRRLERDPTETLTSPFLADDEETTTRSLEEEAAAAPPEQPRFEDDAFLETRAFESPTQTDLFVGFPKPHEEPPTADLAETTDSIDIPPPEEPAHHPNPVLPRPGRRRERPQSDSLLARITGALRRHLSISRSRFKLKIPWRGMATGAATAVRTIIKPPKPEVEHDHNRDWWRRTITEIAALFAIVVPIEMAIRGGTVGAFGVHPHPYWLVVLPMAGARGVVAGLVAAAIASVLYAVGAWRALRTETVAEIFAFKTMLEPILFFGVGYFVGELHDELALRYRKVQRMLADVQTRNTSLRQERDVLSEANRLLERRIVDDSTQFGNLILAAKRIEQSGQREVFEVALDLVEEHCGASASVLLLLEDRSLDFLCHRGWNDEELGTRLAAARRSRFVERVVAEGVAVNGFAPEETVPETGPLVVSPLFDSTGIVKALLCLDDVPATRLNESTITTFLGIGEWISSALARLARGRDAPDPRTAEFSAGPEADIWLGTSEDLGQRLRLELERCARYGVPTSFLAIHAREWKDTSREGTGNLDRFLLTHFTTGLRPSDALYRFGYPGCYLLVLAGTTVEGAEVVRTRLLRRVEYAPRRDIGAIEIFATGPDAEAPDLATLVDRVATRLRKNSILPLEGHCPVSVPDEDKGGTIDQFIRRIKMEASLAARNGFDLHVIGLSADMAGTPADGLLARHVREVGRRLLRPSDGVYGIGPYHCAIVLPCTGGEEAATVAHRLVTAVRARDPDASYGALATQVMGLGASHPDAGSFLDALAKRGGTEGAS